MSGNLSDAKVTSLFHFVTFEVSRVMAQRKMSITLITQKEVLAQ